VEEEWNSAPIFTCMQLVQDVMYCNLCRWGVELSTIFTMQLVQMRWIH